MTLKKNVHPNQYKTKGSTRQGEETVQKFHRQEMEKTREREQREGKRRLPGSESKSEMEKKAEERRHESDQSSRKRK
ncbi:MAG: hypothetical protein WBX15_12075 [Thermoanaerobaculia bacterium]